MEKTSEQFISELCDLIRLMPNSQLDQILVFILTLKSARNINKPEHSSRRQIKE